MTMYVGGEVVPRTVKTRLEDEWIVSDPSRFALVGPRASLNVVDKRKSSPMSRMKLLFFRCPSHSLITIPTSCCTVEF